ncbi:helix-turn-helix transcriptional regulator [Streptomyces sp. NPDC006367]|uniref:helix-turn-helix domain-containing protein n=1 Tax=unclassified Streptomyces TaxID=2593676 RepID=UPI00339E0270
MGDAPTSRSSLAERLTWLFETRHPDGEGPKTYEAVAERSKELASGEVTGVSHQTVLNIASGAVRNPGMNTILSLARVFRVRPSYLMGETDELKVVPLPGEPDEPASDHGVQSPGRASDTQVSVEHVARQLDRLFISVVPRGRGPFSEAEVADALTKGGCPVTASEIAALRTGQGTAVPSRDLLEALAKFFMMPVAYFEDAAVGKVSEEDLKVLDALRSVGAREIAMRAMAELPEEACQALVPMIEHLSRAGRRQRM